MIDDTVRQQRFRRTVRQYYRRQGRHDLPWRQPGSGGRFDPYHILLSEIMLQQTQVGRVILKYEQFVGQWPTLAELAAAPQSEVVRAWSGLGYNRRARFLHQAVTRIVAEHGGRVPRTLDELTQLPAIGRNTAGAILAYAFDQPAVFVETNIRTVFIHYFFDDTVDKVTDTAVLELVATTLDRQHPRDWYWALMDYGAHLKQTVGNLSARSRGYNRQSRFEGSQRQVRGQVIRLLSKRPYSLAELQAAVNDQRLEAVLEALLTERLIQARGSLYQL